MAADPFDLEAARRLRSPILRWYRRAKRDLPWRRTTDPYAIWVSEVMLQQTTVAAVIPYWTRFLDRFPDTAALAAGGEEDVLALWSGLGYYRRARALRDGAIAVMERHDGRVPEDTKDLTALPGVGRYTAGAIASLAFGREASVVDGNVKRVFSRLFAIRGASAATERRYWKIADALVVGGTPGDWNQALMELGATVCTPRAPRCGACPAAHACRACALGTPEAFPAKPKARPARVVPVAVAWIEERGRVLLERRRPDSPFRGTWDLPAAVMASGESSARTIAGAMSRRYGVRLRAGEVVYEGKHAILSSRLDLRVLAATSVARLPRRADLRLVAPDELDKVAISGATKKIAHALTGRQSRSHIRRSSASSDSRGRSKA